MKVWKSKVLKIHYSTTTRIQGDIVKECVYIKDTTIAPASCLDILAPGEVRPGHMILAPDKTNFIAPLSTCSHGRRKGSNKQK